MNIIKYNSTEETTRNIGTTQGTSGAPTNTSTGGASSGEDNLWKKGGAPGSLTPKEGDNITEGTNSIAVGTSTRTTNQGEMAAGYFNDSHQGTDGQSNPANTLFSVGNGVSDESRSNAFEVRENGDVYMWIENDYMQINRLLAMLAHEVYDDDDNSNNG